MSVDFEPGSRKPLAAFTIFNLTLGKYWDDRCQLYCENEDGGVQYVQEDDALAEALALATLNPDYEIYVRNANAGTAVRVFPLPKLEALKSNTPGVEPYHADQSHMYSHLPGGWTMLNRGGDNPEYFILAHKASGRRFKILLNGVDVFPYRGNTCDDALQLVADLVADGVQNSKPNSEILDAVCEQYPMISSDFNIVLSETAPAADFATSGPTLVICTDPRSLGEYWVY